MKCYISTKEVEKSVGKGVIDYPLLDETNGCVAGCCTGITIYATTEYTPNTHDDQEGFLIIEGEGWALVGEEEFRIEEETSFIVPAGVIHAIKRHPDSKPVKVFWFHAAI